MSISDQINDDIKTAMKSKDREKLTALRDIKSKLLLEMTKEGNDGAVEEGAALAILTKLYKQRIDAATIYAQQDRKDLEEEELKQAEVIKAYLPEQLSEADIEAKVKEIIAQTGASSMADMGKVMGMASKAMAGTADGKVISQIVRKILA